MRTDGLATGGGSGAESVSIARLLGKGVCGRRCGTKSRAGTQTNDRAGLEGSKDPTPLLYSALLKQQENRINEAIEDLETSEVLNKNRQIYRSRLLLNSDRAVQGANLAKIYADGHD